MTSRESRSIIRNPGAEERASVRALWDHAFPEDSQAFTSWYFHEMYRPENTLGLYEEGQPRSFLQMNPYVQRIRGRDFPVAAIAGVSTWTQHRHRGFAGRLLWDSLQVLRRRETAAALLYPFNYDFYRPYGYKVIMERKHFTLSADHLPEAEDRGRAVALVGGEWPEKLAFLYRRFMLRFSGYIIRDREMMARRLREHRSEYAGAHGWLRDGRLCAYALHHRQADGVIIDEWAADDEGALAGLLGQAAGGGSGSIEWIGPGTDPFPLKEIRPQVRLEPFTMMRIIDLPGLVRGVPCADDVDPICCEVTDGGCPWNQGIWRMGARDGRVFVEAADGPADIRCDISGLAPMIMAAVREDDFIETKGGALERLKMLFPPVSPFMWEMY